MNCPSLLFIIFNKLEPTKIVFDAIREAQPKELFIAADGPRNLKEKEITDKVRSIIDQINWDCEVKTLFREENLGCKYGVITAINWFFTHVDMGIILEDDCLPSTSFFQFCHEMLEKFKFDTRVMKITGINLKGKWKENIQDYHFSRYGGIWGWATWKRSWKLFDENISLWKDEHVKEQLKNTLGDKEYSLRSRTYDAVVYQNLDTWDYQWSFVRLINSGLTVVPAKNLITNIGFVSEATHTHDSESKFSNMPKFEILFPVKENPIILPDAKYDEKISMSFQNIPQRFIQRVKNKLSGFLNRD